MKIKNKLLMSFGLSIFLLVFSFVLGTHKVSAATINVTPNTSAVTNDGNCSLYEAVDSANTDSAVDACTAGSGADTINIPDGTYSLGFSPAHTDLTLSSNITLNGTSRENTIIDCSGGYAIQISDGGGNPNITIANLSVKNSTNTGLYGVADASITIDNTLWENNSNGTGYGGINVSAQTDGTDYGTFSMTNSIVRNNTGSSSGGLRAQFYVNANISNSVFYNNTGGGNSESALLVRGTNVNIDNVDAYANLNEPGAGIVGNTLNINHMDVYENTGGGLAIDPYIGTSPSLVLHNSSIVNNTGQATLAIVSDTGGYDADIANVTVSGNTTMYTAFFMYTDESTPLTGNVRNVTIANNHRTGNVGFPEVPAGIVIFSGHSVVPTLHMSNVLLSNNLDETTPRNCVPTATQPIVFNPLSSGNNLSSDNSCSTILDQASDQNNKDAKLGALASINNTWVLPLLSNSPAIDSGITVAGVTTDQRGVTRPQGLAYDIGAYEYSGGNGTLGGSANPGVPNTGFGLLTNNPIYIMIITLISTGVILKISRKLNHENKK